jgi:hypothetical protein
MKYAITTTLLCLALALGAQSPDMDRMKRDIEVGENILASLLQEDQESATIPSSGVFLGDRSAVEGSYLEGFGVLFTIAPRHLIGSVNWGEGVYSYSHNQTIVIPRAEVRKRPERTDAADEAEGVKTDTQESRFRKVVETFLADYAYLMRQVPAGEKIMIRYGSRPARQETWGVVVGVGSPSKIRYSAVVEKADLDAHQNGRLNREQLLSRIKFTAEEEGAGKEDRDLTLLTSIFSRLYQSDLSGDDVFRVRGTPSYERIEGLGAVIHVSVGTKFPFQTLFYNGVRLGGRGSNRFNIVIPERLNEEDGVVIEGDVELEEDEEDTEAIDQAYPAFMEELQRNIVEYGSIVKDLAEEEALIFKVNFFDCKACEVMPGKAEITALQSTLEAYRKGSINVDRAVGQLKVSVE